MSTFKEAVDHLQGGGIITHGPQVVRFLSKEEAEKNKLKTDRPYDVSQDPPVEFSPTEEHKASTEWVVAKSADE